jgi:lysophospholipase L1-like esterase
MAAAEAHWQASMDAFAQADKAHHPAPDGVLFVGSSTIRFWSRMAQDFSQAPVVINRGYGGSTLEDTRYFARQLVVQYRPRQVLLYAGDNDLAEGRTPAQVLQSLKGFIAIVRVKLPHTRIDYISIKPSPRRIALLQRMRQTNAMIEAYLRTVPNAGFIDIFNPMLGANGQPRGELFGPDDLHMNDSGYALWKSVISSHVSAGVANTLPTPADAAAGRAASGTPAPSGGDPARVDLPQG